MLCVILTSPPQCDVAILAFIGNLWLSYALLPMVIGLARILPDNLIREHGFRPCDDVYRWKGEGALKDGPAQLSNSSC